jgi:hypothetical protein
MYIQRMALHITDRAAETAVRKLAKLRGITLTRAVEQAAIEAIARADNSDEHKEVDTFEERWSAIQDIQREIAAYPKRAGAIASHKEFFDWINEDK